MARLSLCLAALVCTARGERDVKSTFGTDRFQCPKCGLRFVYIGDGLKGDLRLERGEDIRVCQHLSTVPVECPEIRATLEPVVLKRLQP